MNWTGYTRSANFINDLKTTPHLGFGLVLILELNCKADLAGWKKRVAHGVNLVLPLRFQPDSPLRQKAPLFPYPTLLEI